MGSAGGNISLGGIPPQILKTCRPTPNKALDISLGVICLVLSLLAAAGNLASLIYVKINWKVGNKKRGNYTHQMTMILVVNIALTDFMNGAFSASFNGVNLLRESYPDPSPLITQILCNFCGLVHFLTTRASILLMCCLSVFRYIAITRPTKFNNHRCLWILWTVLILIWVITIFVALLPYYFKTQYVYFHNVYHCWLHFFQLTTPYTDPCDYIIKSRGKGVNKFSFFCLYIMPIHGPGLAMIVFTLLIIIRLMKLHFNVRESKGLVTKKFTFLIELIRPTEDSLHARAAVSTIIILSFFVLTYGTWWIVSLTHFIDMGKPIASSCGKKPFWQCKLGRWYSYLLFFSMNLMVYFNAALNPFIYYYRLFQRSQAIKKRSVYTTTVHNGHRQSACTTHPPVSQTFHTAPLKINSEESIHGDERNRLVPPPRPSLASSSSSIHRISRNYHVTTI